MDPNGPFPALENPVNSAADRITPVPPPGLRPGDTLAGRFRLEARAGVGASGTVFRARDLRTARTVAVKAMHTLGTLGTDRRQRALREAHALAAVQHPAVVGYVAHGDTDAGAWVAMDWVEGETLAARLARTGLSPRETLVLAQQLSSGLAAMHERGIVHRDLKPSNIVLEGGDVARARIVDLGVARDVQAPLEHTGEGAYVGTPRYMAPEQIRYPQRVRGSSDVFALGCIVYECLCGAPAFDAIELFAVLAQILFAPAPALRTRRPELPEELEALVAKLLDRSAERRPQSGAVLNQLFAAALAGASGAAIARLPAPERDSASAPAFAVTAGSGVRVNAT